MAFRLDGPAGPRLGVWRPSERQLRQFPAPEGWLAGSGRWAPGGELLLPYATAAVPCGVARMAIPLGPVAGVGVRADRGGPAVVAGKAVAAAKEAGDAEDAAAGRGAEGTEDTEGAGDAEGAVPSGGGAEAKIPDEAVPHDRGPTDSEGIVLDTGEKDADSTTSPHPEFAGTEPLDGPPHPRMCRPVPLQQAPLATQESRWSAVSGPVSIPPGAVQPVDPATDGTARVASRREPGEVPTRTAVSDLTE
ncbi:hypothetical protein SALB_03647 [Streptomyces noursei]|uniref:Uncharacterized protein n=1 Tax=Streptomyces noursei TaxID=1971 RepID=A0A401QZY7_STRNR|nr:hypothetical protein SALB_03647 [Streptomyces noursei]